MKIISGKRFGKNFHFIYEQYNKAKEYALGQGDVFTVPFSIYLETPILWTSNFKIIDIKKIRLKRKILWSWIPELTKTVVITLERIKEEGENEKANEE